MIAAFRKSRGVDPGVTARDLRDLRDPVLRDLSHLLDLLVHQREETIRPLDRAGPDKNSFYARDSR